MWSTVETQVETQTIEIGKSAAMQSEPGNYLQVYSGSWFLYDYNMQQKIEATGGRHAEQSESKRSCNWTMENRTFI
jgi:hypothetical protein